MTTTRRIVPTSAERHDARMKDLQQVLADNRLTLDEVHAGITPHADALCGNRDGFDSEYREELVKLAYWMKPPCAVDRDATLELRHLLQPCQAEPSGDHPAR